MHFSWPFDLCNTVCNYYYCSKIVLMISLKGIAASACKIEGHRNGRFLWWLYLYSQNTKVNKHILKHSFQLCRYGSFSTPLHTICFCLFNFLLLNKHLLPTPGFIMYSLFQGVCRAWFLNAISNSSRLRLHCLLLLALLQKKKRKKKQPEDDRTKREREDYSSGKKIPHTSEPH